MSTKIDRLFGDVNEQRCLKRVRFFMADHNIEDGLPNYCQFSDVDERAIIHHQIAALKY